MGVELSHPLASLPSLSLALLPRVLCCCFAAVLHLSLPPPAPFLLYSPLPRVTLNLSFLSVSLPSQRSITAPPLLFSLPSICFSLSLSLSLFLFILRSFFFSCLLRAPSPSSSPSGSFYPLFWALLAVAMVTASDDALLKEFFAEVSDVERDNEVLRVLGCFKLNPFEHLNLPFDSDIDEVRRQYRKLSLLIHPDKCKHPRANEAFAALAKAQQLLLDPAERDYIVSQINSARDELRSERRKKLKRDNASKIKSMVDEGKFENQFEQSDEFRQAWKKRVREMLTEQEWRRRKLTMRISEEEGRVKKEEEETREMWKHKREHEEKWEETRENRVSSWRNFQKGGKKTKKGELRPPKLKTEDPNKSYVQRPVKKG